MKWKHALTLGVLLLASTFLAWAIWGQREAELAGVRDLRSPQEADAPDGEPRKLGDDWKVAPFNSRLELLTGSDRFRVPLADRLDFPLGNENGALSYNAQPFWELNQEHGAQHAGDDINGIGGMNSDLGDPVYAVGNGLVIFSGKPDSTWGKTLLIAHRLPDGRLVQSMYSHLKEIAVPFDFQVRRGQRIGRVGNADGRYSAHLHFEMHQADGPTLSQHYLNDPTNHLDPTATINAHRGTSPSKLGPSISQIVEEIQRQSTPLPIGP